MYIEELKEYIYEKEKIEFILDKIGCHNIKFNEHKNYFSASQPDGDNPQGVNIRNNKYLNYRSFSRNVSYDDGKDLISLVEDINNMSFIEAVKYIHNLLGLKFTYKKPKENKNKYDPLEVFKKIEERGRHNVVNVDDIHVLDEEILNDYVPLLYIDWYKEGIMPWTRKNFGLCYSYRYKRVIIPHRYWLTGELIGTNARTTVKNYEEFGIKKYVLTKGFNKHLNLYGLWENYDSIQKAGYVVVAESEKSVLKRDSLNDSTVVALSGKTMSDEQARILIGLNVEIVIGLDVDVNINEVRHMADRFYNIRPVSYMYDKWNLLGEKDSPADARNKDYQLLFENRIKYDENEHNKYLKSLERR